MPLCLIVLARFYSITLQKLTRYFAVGSRPAYGAIHQQAGPLAATIGMGLYCGGFAVAMYLITSDIRLGTQTAKDP